jgi:hypothetical protein
MLVAASALAGDVDSDDEFDASDSFLIHPTKLAGTGTQLEQSKGASPRTTADIRMNIDD